MPSRTHDWLKQAKRDLEQAIRHAKKIIQFCEDQISER